MKVGEIADGAGPGLVIGVRKKYHDATPPERTDAPLNDQMAFNMTAKKKFVPCAFAAKKGLVCGLPDDAEAHDLEGCLYKDEILSGARPSPPMPRDWCFQHHAFEYPRKVR